MSKLFELLRDVSADQKVVVNFFATHSAIAVEIHGYGQTIIVSDEAQLIAKLSEYLAKEKNQ